MRTYSATVTREGKWWMVAIPEIDGLTQARRLSEAGQMAREYIALATGVELDDVAVNVTVRVVAGLDALQDQLDRLVGDRRILEEVSRRVAEEQVRLARQLVAAHVPMRDVGELLGVSHQRVGQLVG